MLLEFSGLKGHEAAWKNSASYKVLNETSTGEMLRDLAAQAAEYYTFKRPERRLNGGDLLALIEHTARNGLVFGVTGPVAGQPGDSHGVIVIRNATDPETKKLFGKLLAETMGPEAKPKAGDRGTRRIVEYTPKGSETRWAWWVENGDLVFTHANDLDLIFAVLDGNATNAVEHPTRVELSAAEGPFEPVGWMFLDISQFPESALPPEQRAQFESLRASNLKRIDYRWGFEGPATMGVARILAPEPRSGALAMMDQPTFNIHDLPPMPAGVDRFAAFAFEPLGLYEQLTGLMIKSKPEAQAKVQAFEKKVQDTVHRNLRQDILGARPKAVVYAAPTQRAAAMGGFNPLAAVAASTSVQVPKITLVVEVKDPDAFTRSLDELIILANQTLEQQMGGGSGAREDGKKSGSRRSKDDDDGPEPPRFRLISSSPKTFVLQLPESLGSMVNMNLTIALGRKHLAVASTAELARQALALENSTEGRWVPIGNLAETLGRLPETLTFLQINDSTDTLPDALANLPQTVDALMTTMTASREQATAGQVAATPGRNAPDRVSEDSGGAGGYESLPEESVDSLDESASGPVGPGPGQGQGGKDKDEVEAPTIHLDPAKAPSVAAVRPLLFPGSTAASVDAQGMRIVTRTAFPNIASPSNGMSLALLMPAIQAARDAARRVAAGEGIVPPENPLGALGVNPVLSDLGAAWAPDPAMLQQLGEPQDVAGYQVRPPTGFTRQTLASAPNVRGAARWLGPRRDDGSTPNLQLTVLDAASAPNDLDDLLTDEANTLKKDMALEDWKAEPIERGTIDGHPFGLLEWQALHPGAKKTLHGFLYASKLGEDAVVILSQDLSRANLEPAKAAALTFHGK